VPLLVAERSLDVLELAGEAAESGNASASSDAGSAGALARAALTAAAMNVRVNAKGLKDRQIAAGWEEALARLEPKAAEAEARLKRALEARLGSSH
jgi:glutamate formiminotransferase/formiminotetrahydrofolate cyclodeaminase